MPSFAINKKKALYWAITIILAAAGYFLPLGEVYTMPMKRFFAITILGLCILAFELMDNFALGMMMPTLWVMTGVTDFATAFSPYVSSNFFLLLNAMLFAMILAKTGLMNRIGYSLIVKFGGTYESGVWAIFIIGTVLSFVSMMNSAILTCTIALSMIMALGIKPNEKAAVPIMTAVVLSCANAKVICYSPISITIMNASVQSIIPDFLIDYPTLVWHNWPMFVFMILFQWAVLKWYQRSRKKSDVNFDLSAFKAENMAKYQALGKMSNNERICTVMLISIFAWMGLYTLKVIPFDVVYAFILANVVFYLLGIADASDVRQINFGMTVVVMAFVAVGTVATQINATALISSGIAHLFGSLSGYWASFATLLFGTAANFVLTPYAMMSMLPATVAAYCQELGLAFFPQFNACYNAADIIFFPYEYPLILIIFGFGLCNMAQTVKMLTSKALTSIAFIALIMMPYWYLLGLYN